MKKWTFFAACAIVVAMVAAGTIFSGCEEEPNVGDITDVGSYFDTHPFPSDVPTNTGSSVDITPDSASVTFVGQSVTFLARGGTPNYHWNTDNDVYGEVVPLSANGDTANYVVNVLAPNAVVVRDSVGRAAQATIQASASTSFKIIPSSVVFSVAGTNLAECVAAGKLSPADGGFSGEEINFTTVGGIPDYTEFKVTLPSLGVIVSQVYTNYVRSATYRANTNGLMGTNIVWVADKAGTVAQAIVVTSAQIVK